MSVVPHIEVALKVIEVHAPAVARATKQPVTHIIGGLNLLWHRTWSLKRDTVSRTGLAGIFGPDGLDDLIASLVEEGFLEATDDGWRIKGADAYLRLAAARSKGGHAAKSNLIPGARQKSRLEPRTSRETAENQPRDSLGSDSALPPLHRTPNTEPLKTAAAVQVVRFPNPQPQKPTNRHDSGSAYLAFLNQERLAAGLMVEASIHPSKFDAWFSEVMGELNGDGARLDATVAAFSRDPYWKKEGLPLRALLKQWRDFVPRKAG